MAELLVRLDAARARMPLELARGADEQDLRMLGEVPEDLRALYAYANGSETAIYYRYRLAPISAALDSSRVLGGLAHEQFGTEYWDARFIPFLDKVTGDNLYVDVAGVHGPPGCVVDFNHERPAEREVVFDSVAQWLEQLVEGIEQDKYEWADQGVFPRGLIDDGDPYDIRRFTEIYTNHAYPWQRTLALNE
jgi:cell wall assembly regulator SMI1